MMVMAVTMLFVSGGTLVKVDLQLEAAAADIVAGMELARTEEEEEEEEEGRR